MSDNVWRKNLIADLVEQRKTMIAQVELDRKNHDININILKDIIEVILHLEELNK